MSCTFSPNNARVRKSRNCALTLIIPLIHSEVDENGLALIYIDRCVSTLAKRI